MILLKKFFYIFLYSFINQEKKSNIYIIYAPPYGKSNGIKALYTLHDILNKLGYKTYIYCKGKHRGNYNYLYKIKKYHKENAIIIYPESIKDNPLDFKNVVRWILYFPGYFGGNTVFNNNELIFSWNKEYYDATKLQVPSIDNTIFYNDPTIKKDLTCYFVYKGNFFKEIPQIKNAYRIDQNTPKDRNELINILHRTNTLYSFDSYSTLNDEALSCGAKVYIVTPEGLADYTKINDIDYDESIKLVKNFIETSQKRFYNKQ